jgi:hypothetical protein
MTDALPCRGLLRRAGVLTLFATLGLGEARAEPAPNGAGGDAPPPPSSGASSPPTGGVASDQRPRAVVASERPYRVGARPRPQGAVQASVADEDLARWNVGGSGDPRISSSRPGFHPAPRVLVEISVRNAGLPKRAKSKRAFSEASLVAQTRNAGYWPFRLCFEDGLRRDPALRGKTRVRFVVESSGRVKSERMAFTELKDLGVAKCLSARVRTLHFSPAPAKRVHADVTIDLGPGDAPLPETNLAESPGSAPASEGGKLDEGAVSRALSEQLGRIAACYEQGLGRDPKLWGRVAILMDVDPDGRVRTAAEYESHFPDPAVPSCAVDGLRGVLLPPPIGGPLRLVWPLKLGTPPLPEVTPGRSGSAQTLVGPKRTVAEAGPPRVPVAK